MFNLDNNGKIELSDDCKFKGKGFNINHELGECSIASQLIPHVTSVLEIGGGAGKVSHMINSKLKNPLKHIVVEPGSSGRGNHGDTNLWENKRIFNDKYTIVKKFAHDLEMNDLKTVGYKPECVFVDCEGCLLQFFNTKIGKHVLKHASYIVNEMDGFTNKKVTNIDEKLVTLWKNNGYKRIGIGYGCGVNCTAEVWYKTSKSNKNTFFQSFNILIICVMLIIILIFILKKCKNN